MKTPIAVTRGQLFSTLPAAPPANLLPQIRERIRRKVVVLDDDPTGTQTVHGIPVLTEWPVARLRAELANELPCFYLLTHSRSLPERDAELRNKEIGSALAGGVSSVMAHGSHLDYGGNVAFTQEMTAQTQEVGAAVEAELGRIRGTEDGLTVAAFEARFTDPKEAARFVEETDVDALAVCIGNVHGPYPAEPRLDFERLPANAGRADLPLVLHGTSGLPDAMIERAVSLGVTKFNVNTEVRRAYLAAARERLQSGVPELLEVMEAAIAAMVVARHKIRLFQSSGIVSKAG